MLNSTYFCISAEERHRRMVLFLKTINSDQWEALNTMCSNNQSFSYSRIEIIEALKILADCKSSTKSESRVSPNSASDRVRLCLSCCSSTKNHRLA